MLQRQTRNLGDAFDSRSMLTDCWLAVESARGALRSDDSLQHGLGAIQHVRSTSLLLAETVRRWGCGRDGKKFFQLLRRENKAKVAAFLDIDPSKVGGSYVDLECATLICEAQT